MQCPRCAGTLETVSYRGISVDRCTTCQGLWFDILEAETLRKVEGADRLDIGEPEGAPDHGRPGPISCPKCQTLMTSMVDKNDPDLTYEKCPVCYGVWFEAGKFRGFQQSGFWHSLKKRLSGKERRGAKRET